MNITIKTIPHVEHRYAGTCGDWTFDADGNLEIRVSDMGNWKYEAIVAFHELVEVLLCKDRGITADMVDQFDMAYEAARPDDNTDEPGNDPECPYRVQHLVATQLESQLADELDVEWADYADAVDAL